MENLQMELQRTVLSGRTQSGKIVAYYEQHLEKDGIMSFLFVSFFEDNSTVEILDDGTEQKDVREDSLRATIEYSDNMFRCQIANNGYSVELWNIYWEIFNALKTE